MATAVASTPIFQDLSSKNKDVRQKAGQELLHQVTANHRELPPDRFQEYFGAVVKEIAHKTVTSPESTDKLGGITAIENLLTFGGDDSSQKVSRFVSYLDSALRSNDLDVLVRAAEVIGQLSSPGGPLTSEIVESETKQALEWLAPEPRQETRRFAAVLVIRELAKNSPTLLYDFVPQILQQIWTAVRDPKVFIRETAASAVAQCLQILLARDPRIRQHWFTKMYQDLSNGVKSNQDNVVHGSLLILREFLLNGGMFMQEKHTEACDVVLGLKGHRDIKVRTEVVRLIPVLAAYSPQEFCAVYLHKFMVFLSGQLKKEKERNVAFVAIGELSTAVGSCMAPYLDMVLVAVREGLGYRAKNGQKDGAVFSCISMLAVATGQTLTKYIPLMLDPMFACGLSEELTQALVDMAHYIPPVKPQIQEKLLHLISLVLCGRPFKPLGCPENRLPPTPAFAREWKQNGITHGEAEITIALQTLGSFDFKGHILNEFVRDVALRFVKNSNQSIRKAAALTCCQIYVNDPIIQQTSFHSIGVVRQVVSQLLSAAVGDPIPEIRKTILDALVFKFDKHLGEQENIRKLIMAINDSDFEVRKSAMQILGRLIHVNPAYVFPPLRKLLQNFSMAVWAAHDSVYEEEAAMLVSLCARNACDLVRPYVNRLVELFLPKTMDSNPTVAATVLMAIGDLSLLGGTEMKPYIPQLMPVIIDALQDLSAPGKRQAALQTLGQLASNSGYVIAPYIDHPQLLDLLIGIIKGESHGPLRHETIKLLGTLGALDPYKHQQSLEHEMDVQKQDHLPVSDVELIMQGLTPSSEEYYPMVVMHTLMNNVLRDSSLSQYHKQVVEAIVNIFKTLGLKCVPFLPQIIPTLISVIRGAPQGRLQSYFNDLATLVLIVREHIRSFSKDLVGLILEFWNSKQHQAIRFTILSLVQALTKALKKEFYPFMVKLLPPLLEAAEQDSAAQPDVAQKIMQTMLVFAPHADQSLWLIVPKLIRAAQDPRIPVPVRQNCMSTLAKMGKQINLSDFSAVIMQGLMLVLGSREKSLRDSAYQCVITFIYEFPQDVLPFLDGVKLQLQQYSMPQQDFDRLATRVKAGEQLPQDLRPSVENKTDDDATYTDVTQRKLPVNQEHLKSAWQATNKSTKEDWQEWMRRFGIELLKESPSNALRACASLAAVYPPLSRDLFNSAFVSCWTELYDQYQEELVHSLETALTSPTIPPDILQILLNLAEFMEHDDKPLPIDIGTLGVYAGKCHAYAKALHYKELEFEEEKTPAVVEALISINNQLQQTDAAVGILRNAQKYRDFELKETWFEKLGRWDEALNAWQAREREEPDSFEVIHGKMRCLHALGEWESLSNLTQDKWNLASIEHKRLFAPLAAAASWGLNHWEHMDNYLEAMKVNSPDRSFFGAISALHSNNFAEAQDYIDRARLGLDAELSALLSESYTRAYSVVVRVQMLAELEEIIAYKKCANEPERQATMRETWKTRLLGCEGNVETWQRMLKVRQLVLTSDENVELWIKYANLCRKTGRPGLAEKTIRGLESVRPENESVLTELTGIPEVTYAQKKYEWAIDHKEQALVELQEFAHNMADRTNALAVEVERMESNPPNPMNVFMQGKTAELRTKKEELSRAQLLLSKCYLRIGQWMTHQRGADWVSSGYDEILASYHHATQYNPDGYKAWHAWALANFDVVNAVTSTQTGPASFPQATIEQHVIPAIQGFFKSISLSTARSSLQDTLRLLTLWFAHGAHPDVNNALLEGFPKVSNDTWLEVIPQLIARINQPNARVRAGVHGLLSQLGKAHPQALVYPLTVAMKSEVRGRSESAKAVMDKLRNHSPLLVDQGQLVSRELIRVAVLWHELWHEGLEEASRLYFGDHNTDAMFAVLAPLHKLLDDGPQTLREISFVQTFGRELTEAKHWGETYRTTGELGDINQAWDLYYGVFKRIGRQLPQLMTLDLKYVSPQLKDAKNLDLAVPGTYRSGKPVTRIVRFDKIFTVIPSKQRPRKMTLQGSDGQSYTYALKGHEDIRQDERVMQLFALCNMLLASDAECFKRHLNIQTFPAIPLSQSSGILGWVPNSDTLHNLIKEYRDNRRILLNIEHRIMLQMAPDYDNLTLMQKVEVFSYAMDNTTGKDLYRVLWLKSKSSESWLERRTNYTRSLAVMSMVGYILGLGDRHPSNLMLDRATGKVVHIDFGDCFEIAMHREKYPERVPFRLTRMLTFAMEVSNIDGSYKISCEAVMRVIRENKESLLAVLEAFIHDPLVNWRLTTRESPFETGFVSERRESLIGGAAEGAGAVSHHPPSTRRRASIVDEIEAAAAITGSRPTTASIRGRGRSSAAQQQQQQQQDDPTSREVQNQRALQVLARVKEKLNGLDFKNETPLAVDEQVARLIQQATSIENICQHYIGWCSFW